MGRVCITTSWQKKVDVRLRRGAHIETRKNERKGEKGKIRSHLFPNKELQ